MALRYLNQQVPGHVANVKNISKQYRIPSELLAKVMQQLKKHGIVSSIKGTSGGYSLNMALEDISFLDYLQIFEEDTALVECLNHAPISCHQLNCCDIRGPLSVINTAVQQQFRVLSLQQVFCLEPPNSIKVPSSVLAASDA